MRWSAKVDGRALGLAFNAGRLLVSTDTGALYCFSATATEKTIVEKPQLAELSLGLAKRLAKPSDNSANWGFSTIVFSVAVAEKQYSAPVSVLTSSRPALNAKPSARPSTLADHLTAPSLTDRASTNPSPKQDAVSQGDYRPPARHVELPHRRLQSCAAGCVQCVPQLTQLPLQGGFLHCSETRFF